MSARGIHGVRRIVIPIAALALFCLPEAGAGQQVERGVQATRPLAQGARPLDYGAWPLEPGDAIRISAWREEALSGDYAIDERGNVVLPMLGVRHAAGLPQADLERRLKEEYAGQLRNQEVEITFLRRISMLGSVRAPGLYMLEPTMRLSDAIALAGGTEPDGRPNHIRIYRAGVEVTESVDLTRLLAGQLRSGDEIRVPRSSWLTRNGLVLGASLISATAILLSTTLN